MTRILAIDYGLKRTGLAVSDPLRIIANPLEVVETNSLFNYLKSYFGKEKVEIVVVGRPVDLFNQPTHLTVPTDIFIEKLKKLFPGKKIESIDERFTSKMAGQAMIQGGMKKKDRKQKGNLDKISATLILQSFLEAQHP
jgi:putative Holliday junction resolvase